MNKLIASFVAGTVFFVSACGRITEKQTGQELTSGEALNVLSQVPMESQDGGVSVQGLEGVLKEAVDSGEVEATSAGRSAVLSSKNSASTLKTLLDLVGQTQDLASVAQGLIDASAGNVSSVTFNLDSILNILKGALPFVMVFAPPFAIILQAVIALVPVLQSILNSIAKAAPKSA